MMISAVLCARTRSLVWTTSILIADSSRPASSASSTPWSERSTSVQPVKRFEAFQTDCPWRTSMSLGMSAPYFWALSLGSWNTSPHSLPVDRAIISMSSVNSLWVLPEDAQ